MRKYRLTESALHNMIHEEINNVVRGIINESRGNDPITKWVYWCYNYHNPQDWMQIFDDPDHFMKKFMHYYDTYGSQGVMNRFFIELDRENQQRLIDYVMNNYNG